jgi:hypothetical protein
MGACSSPCTYNNDDDGDDLMHVEAIRRPQHLDWRQHVKSEEARNCILEVQRNPPVQIIDDFVFLMGATTMLDKSRPASICIIMHILNAAGQESQEANTRPLDPNDSEHKANYKMLRRVTSKDMPCWITTWTNIKPPVKNSARLVENVSSAATGWCQSIRCDCSRRTHVQ